MGKLTPGDSSITDDFNEMLGYDANPVGLSLSPQILPIACHVELSLSPETMLGHRPMTPDLLLVPFRRLPIAMDNHLDNKIHQFSYVDCIHYPRCLMGKLTLGDSRITDDFNELLGCDAFPVGLSFPPSKLTPGDSRITDNFNKMLGCDANPIGLSLPAQIMLIVCPVELSFLLHLTLGHRLVTPDLLVVPSVASLNVMDKHLDNKVLVKYLS
ncbi:hypothetical protein OIU84_008186 [Salix udensis]|uniref:Uncharacterized protein n=1 Tax=Salix udensis TaxID=889485 RepID=A0AAD6P067_9ROSI|nr:hypothetical protein OIU84_008186 [Salix udensis]